MNIMTIKDILLKYFAIQGDTRELYGESDLNYRIESAGETYLLKVSPAETDISFLHFQNDLLNELKKRNSDLSLPHVIKNKAGQEITEVSSEGRKRYVRLLSWIPGRIFADVTPKTPDLLENLGASCGKLSGSMAGYRHDLGRREMSWDISGAGWVKEHSALFHDKGQKKLFDYFFNLFETLASPVLSGLRKSIVYNDTNDHNIIVTDDRAAPKIVGFIDFGDAVYTHTVNELAIAIAYAVMEKENPLEAATCLVKGFQSEFPLLEEEVDILFVLICTRLLLTVTHAALNRQKQSGNEYHSISEKAAWDLLKKFINIHPEYATMTFRYACGWEPCKKKVTFLKWLEKEKFSFMMDMQSDKREIHHLDMSVGSTTLGNNSNFIDLRRFNKHVQDIFFEFDTGLCLGGYGEVRPIYNEPAFEHAGDNGKEWRTVHLGIDCWPSEERQVIAPLEGVVFSVKENQGKGNYGPTLILEHTVHPDLTFYTLYGHMEEAILTRYEQGQVVARGEKLGTPGSVQVNGGWPPHLHFQIILDLLGNTNDFPGVCLHDQKEVWQSICPDPQKIAGIEINAPTISTTEALLEKRKSSLGSNLSLSYKKPLHIQRGYGQYLYDHTGRKFLDTVNNVAHVGHEHPAIVKVIQQQSGVLNTNTRYLHQNILDYSEKLLATFPAALTKCFFVNSGSEANELALRMARAHTGQRDIIAVEVGYHGNTANCINVSSYKFDGKGGKGRPEETSVAGLPDMFRGTYRNRATAGEEYAKQVEESIHRLENLGRKPAAFICESILSCGGQIPLPDGYLKKVYREVRRAGGVCIADEVQVGFGRVGEKFWGFELQGVVPDIVTLGKPMGNGHPLAAVITTDAMAESFANGMEYFNTYGGNPVSCAVGLEVLRVIGDEELQENALKMGGYFKEELKKLQADFPLIGDVRGEGLFLGFEMINNPETLEPAREKAAWFTNRMRENGILTSTDGRDENVIKIKPPLCITRDDIDYFINRMALILKDDFMVVE